MKKSFLLGVLFGGILFALLPGISLALSAPLNPSQSIVETTYDYIAIDFSWDKNTEPIDPAEPAKLLVEWYHLVYQCKENCSGGDATWVIQPTASGSVSKTVVGGFDFSRPTKTVKYQWRVGACSAQASGDCEYTSPIEFTTPLQPPSPGGGPGGGGTTPIISSNDLNPISAKNLPDLFNKIFSFLFGLSIFIVPVIVIYAAFLMLMGGGDPIKLQKGRMILLWTAIAFIIILLSRGLPVVFKNLL